MLQPLINPDLSGKNLLLFIVLFISIGLFAIDDFAGSCLEFDGVDDYVNIENASSLNTGNTITIEAWIKPTDLSTRQGIYSTRKNNLSGSFQLEVGPGSGGTNRIAVTGVYTSVAQTNDNAITLNEWNHIVYTRSGTGAGTHKIYVNGDEQNLISDANYTFMDNSADKVIASGTNNTQLYEGLIDEIRIWNVARSQNEIQDNMNKTLEGTETGLISYWQFNESTGTSLSDAVGTNDGLLNNMENSDWVTSTIPFLPSITTTVATNITQTTALSGGDVTYEGSSSVTARGVCWTTTAEPTISDSLAEGFSNDLQNYWRFNETSGVSAYNEVSNNDGILYYLDDTDWISSTIPVTNPNIGNCLDFDGINDYLSFGNDSSLNIENNFTLEMWIKVQNRSTNMDILHKGENRLMFWDQDYESYPGAGFQINIPGLSTGWWEFGDEINYDEWNHVAWSFSETGELIAYINGQNVRSGTFTGSIVSNTDLLTLSTDLSSEKFKGCIDEVKIWNTARSQVQIQDDMNMIDDDSINFSTKLSELDSSTTYYYRAYATNSVGTDYGEEYSFTTLDPVLPTVTTTLATNITKTTAESGGGIPNDGGSDIIAKGVCWSTSVNPTIADNYTTDGTGIDSFLSNLTGLTQATTYYYRAYATNSVGTAYGEEYSFGTNPAGSGTEADPYQISTLEHLRWLSENSDYWDDHFIQTADIDASSTSSWNSGAGFSPIGNETIHFTGYYNGQEAIIDSLFIDVVYDRRDYNGLFGYVSGADITNLGMTNLDIDGCDYTGGLVGYCGNSSVINNCYCSGSIDGWDFVGGLVGMNDGSSSITNCYTFSGEIDGDLAGGLVGKNVNGSSISYCYSLLTVSGCADGGGLVGINSTGSSISCCYTSGDAISYDWCGGLVYINEHNSTIDNCFNTKEVLGMNCAGGLVGRNDSGSTITNCFNAANVEAWGNLGGLVADGDTAFVYNSFWDADIAPNVSTSAGGTELTTPEMQTLNTFTDAGWDFVGEEANGTDDLWKFLEGHYPMLAWQESPPIADFEADQVEVTTNSSVQFTNLSVANFNNCEWEWDIDNDGTIDYTTENCNHTYSIAGTYSVKLTATNSLGSDILIKTDYITVTETNELTGTGTSQDPYQISTLAELRFVSENDSYWDSHFIQTADIDASDTQSWNSDLGFSPIGSNDVHFTGDYDGNGKTISNLVISRENTDNIGLFGFAQSAVISDLSIENADIIGNGYVGGLIGRSHNTTIQNCFSEGLVEGDYNNVGGLVGEIFDNSTISNCYSNCEIIGNSHLGGLVGRNSLNSSVIYCYSTGSLQGTSFIGGLVGYTSSSSTVSSSFWDTETSQQNSSSGGVGKTTIEMQTEITYTNAGWDFVGETANGTDNIWIIYDSSYPSLSNQNKAPNIASIYDVPNDQGRCLNVCWNRSSYDDVSSPDPIVSYNLWIKYPYPSRGFRITSDINEARISYNSNLRDDIKIDNSIVKKEIILLNRNNDLWISVGSTTAMSWDQYTMSATTYQDSSAIEDNPSTFFVSAHTSTPSNYYSSDVMSGYSLDNIQPDAARNVQICAVDSRSDSFEISWDHVTQGTYQGNSYPELNGVWYNIYSSDNPDFVCDETTYLATIQNNSMDIEITIENMIFFKVVVSDQPDSGRSTQKVLRDINYIK